MLRNDKKKKKSGKEHACTDLDFFFYRGGGGGVPSDYCVCQGGLRANFVNFTMGIKWL